MSIQINHLSIKKEYIEHPHKNPKLRFSEGINGRICCPISLEELNIGDICLKVQCCFHVFKMEHLQKSLIDFLHNY